MSVDRTQARRLTEELGDPRSAQKVGPRVWAGLRLSGEHIATEVQKLSELCVRETVQLERAFSDHLMPNLTGEAGRSWRYEFKVAQWRLLSARSPKTDSSFRILFQTDSRRSVVLPDPKRIRRLLPFCASSTEELPLASFGDGNSPLTSTTPPYGRFEEHVGHIWCPNHSKAL